MLARGLIETLSNATWTRGSQAGVAAVLSGVSRTGVHSCVAVGSYLGKTTGDAEGEIPDQGTIETLPGSAWSITKASIPANDELGSVAGPAVGACVAIGTGLTTSETGAIVIETQSRSASPGQGTAPVTAVASRPHRRRSAAGTGRRSR